MYGNFGTGGNDPINLPQATGPSGARIGLRRPIGNMGLGMPAPIQPVSFGGPQGGGPAGEPGGQGMSNPFDPTVAHRVGLLGLQRPPQQWYRQGGGEPSAMQDPGVAGPGDPADLLDPAQALKQSRQNAAMSPLLARLSGNARGGSYYQTGG